MRIRPLLLLRIPPPPHPGSGQELIRIETGSGNCRMFFYLLVEVLEVLEASHLIAAQGGLDIKQKQLD